ncbi:MAG: hypothetical protein QXL17_02725 [Candidatus Thermoplasmatota archaeon]
MKTIEIDVNFFEHLLNCLANQKFIESSSNKKEDQEIIDAAYRLGMDLLLNHTIKNRMFIMEENVNGG